MKSIIAAIFLISVSFARASDLVIRIHDHATAHGTGLVLGDIALFEGFNPAESAYLNKIALGNAPAFGESRSFSNQALTEILRVHLKSLSSLNAKHIRLDIPDQVSIEGNGLIITREAVLALMRSNLKSVCENCEFKIEDLRLPEIPKFSPDTRWELRADYTKLKGPFNLALEIEAPGADKAIYWVTGRVSVWKTVPVSTRLLSIQDRIETADVKWIKRDITFLPDTTPGESDLKGAQIKSSIGPDQVILQSHLVRSRALNRGDVVTVTIGGKEWSLTLKGVAQDYGYLGDTVRVLNSETKKIVTGKVVAQGMVEVK